MEASQCSAESDNKEKAILPVLHEDIRNQDVPFDFAINVGDESFPVHQITLTTHSEYFRAMLTHDTKENQQGFVDMKDVSVHGVRECVEFMYSGKVNVEAETVEDILKVADMMQLVKVIEICTQFLNQILKSGNCVSVYNLTTKYSFPELKKKAQEFYEESIDIELTELLQLSKNGFVQFLETSSLVNEVAWDCIINWIKYDLEVRSELIHDLVKLIDWDQFSSPLLLQRLWAESIFRNCSMCRELLFESLFFDLELFESNLSVQTYFILKSLSNEFKHVIKQIKDMLLYYFKKEIIVLSKEPDFKRLDFVEILFLFENEKSGIFAPETWWWHTAVTWVKHSSNRKIVFPKLIRTIRFDKLASSFKRSVVENEPLVKSSDGCCQIFLNFLSQPLRYMKTKASFVVLYSDGRVRNIDVRTKSWTNLRSFQRPVQNAKIFYFNGKLCLINGANLFYLQGNKWVKKRSMFSDLTGPTEITVLDDCVYVVCANKLMLCYNSSHDNWNEFTLPTEIKLITSVASLNSCVHLFENGKVNTFDVAKQEWSVRNSEGCSWISVVINEEIYVCRSNKNVGKLDSNFKFSKLEDIPHQVEAEPTNQSAFREPKQTNSLGLFGSCVFGSSSQSKNSSGFAFGPPAPSYSSNSHTVTVSTRPAEPHSLLNLNDRLAVVINNKIYLHDDICDKWNYFASIPKFSGGIKGNEITIDMISVCVFFEDTI